MIFVQMRVRHSPSTYDIGVMLSGKLVGDASPSHVDISATFSQQSLRGARLVK
jgi:hypothetical protein